jgi:hypothetical protein
LKWLKIILGLVNLGAAVFFAVDLAGHAGIMEWRDIVILVVSAVFLLLNSIFIVLGNYRQAAGDSRFVQPRSVPQAVVLMNGDRRFFAGVVVAVCCVLLLAYGMNEIRSAISGGGVSGVPSEGDELSRVWNDLRNVRLELTSVRNELKEVKSELSGTQIMLFEAVKPQW